MMNISEQFIIENKDKTMEQVFPQLFSVKLISGNFYIADKDDESNKGNFFYFDGQYSTIKDPLGWGLLEQEDCLIKANSIGWSTVGIKIADRTYVEARLIELAKKRGYGDRNYRCLLLPSLTHKTDGEFYLSPCGTKLHHGERGASNVIMNQGVWADTFKTITQKQAEELLGVKII